MTRVKGYFKPSDLPADADEVTRHELGQLFGFLFPQSAAPKLERKQAAFAVVARNPRLGLMLAQLTLFMVQQMPWTCEHSDLRELATQTLNRHFKCNLSYESHAESARSLGISDEMIAATAQWRTSPLFNEEQRLIVEYTFAVIAADVPEELFERVVAKFGETGTVECTSGIALWAFWAMIINATCPGDLT